MLELYWDVGRMIEERQQREGWGSSVIPRLARDIKNEFSEVKGFSERNLKRMTQFYREYPDFIAQKGPLPVAQLPWVHNVLLIQKVKNRSIRLWYMQKTMEQG